MGAESETTEQGKRVMAGHLEEVDIFSVAQFLMLQQKTGTLDLRADDKAGKVYFDAGQVIGADDGGGDDPEEMAFRLFQWKTGDFDFYATDTAEEKRIQKDTQSLLFEMAVRMDEESAAAGEEAEEAAPEAPAAAVEATPAPGAPAPVKAKAVAPGKAVARLVKRPGAAKGAADMSETQFMQAVQDRLTVFVDELPETSGREWRQERAAAGTGEAPARKIGILLSMITTAVLLAMVIVLVKKRPPKQPPPPPVENQQEVKIKLPPSYTFVTAPFTPEREAEDAVRKIPFKCRVTTIDVVGDNLDKALVVLQKDSHWGTEELKNAAEHDAAHVVNNIFKSPNCKTIKKIDVKVQAHIGIGEETSKWSDVLTVDAARAAHKNVTLKRDDECSRFLMFFNVRTRYE